MTTLLDKNIQSIEQISEKIVTIVNILDNFEKIDYNTLSVNDKIKLNNTLAYCYSTLCFALSKLEDNSANGQYIKKELVRIKNAFRKVKKD